MVRDEAGITVSAVCPGYVFTHMVEQQIPDTAKARGISAEEVIRDLLLTIADLVNDKKPETMKERIM